MKYTSTSSTLLFVLLAAMPAFAMEKSLTRVKPFELPRGIYSKDNIPQEEPQELNLEAIFTIKGQKIATISGQNFIEGDFVSGKRLTRIFKDRVTLDDAGKEESLTLNKNKKFSIRKYMHN